MKKIMMKNKNKIHHIPHKKALTGNYYKLDKLVEKLEILISEEYTGSIEISLHEGNISRKLHLRSSLILD